MADLGWFGFTAPPPVGLRIRYRKQFVTLTSIKPRERDSGEPGWLLTWRTDDGRTGTSGLRGKDISWTKS